MDTFASAVRRARVERRLTQAELARQLGVSSAFVSKLERGAVTESDRIASRCLELLGVSRANEVSVSSTRGGAEQMALSFCEVKRPEPLHDPYLGLLPTEIPQSTEPDIRVWDIPQTITELSYLTHGFFRYYGKFPSTLARRLIRDFRPSGSEVIFDNFLGSGTTLVEARLEGHRAIGLDSSPLAVLASRVKVDTTVDLHEVRSLVSPLQQAMKVQSNGTGQGVAGYEKWFNADVVDDLARLRRGLLQLPPSAARQFLALAFFAIIRRVSTAHDGEVRPHVNPKKRPRDVWLAFSKKVDEMIARAEEYRRYCRTAPAPEAYLCDARSPNPVLSRFQEPIGLVISHPPYLNCFDYIPVYKLEFMWTDGFSELEEGWDYRGLPSQQLKSWPASTDVITSYFAGLKAAFSALLPRLARDAHVAVVIGDCTSKGELIPVLDLFANDMVDAGYRLHRTILRTTHYGIGKYAYAHRADYHGTKADKRDGVLVFRRD